MRAIKYREMKRMVESMGERAFCGHLTEAIKAKELAPEDFSFRELWEALYGKAGLDAWRGMVHRRELCMRFWQRA